MNMCVLRLVGGVSTIVLLMTSCGRTGPAGQSLDPARSDTVSESEVSDTVSELEVSDTVRLALTSAAPADSVRHLDTLIWDDVGKDKRGVRVTITIPSGRDSVVIERVGRDTVPGDDELEFHAVNWARVLVPSMLPGVRVASGNKAGSKVTLSVQLRRCAPLVLAVREYVAGNVVRHVLPQKHGFPSCCSGVAPASAAGPSPNGVRDDDHDGR